MENQVNEQIQARRVKGRLRMLQHAQRMSGNVSQTRRFFGVSRALFYFCKHRYEKSGLASLRHQPHRPHNIRYRIPPEIVRRSSASAKNAALALSRPAYIFNGTVTRTSLQRPSSKYS